MMVPTLISDHDEILRHLEVVATVSIMNITGSIDMLLNKYVFSNCSHWPRQIQIKNYLCCCSYSLLSSRLAEDNCFICEFFKHTLYSSSVSKVTSERLNDQGSIPDRGKDYSFATMSRLVLGHMLYPLGTRSTFSRVERLECKDDH
jgi:hypothetical protein